jgi:Tol biopolymer transport system component
MRATCRRVMMAVVLTGLTLAAGGPGTATASHVADGPSYEPSISADGRYVAFRSYDTKLVPGDTNEADDVFLYDRTADTTTRVSIGSGGVEGDNDSSAPAVSSDGRFVAFRSYASNLVAGDTNEVEDVFVHDQTTGATSRVSVDSGGGQANAESDAPSISADGRYVAFGSDASNLVAGDTNGAGDVFVSDRAAASTSRISVSSSGGQGDGASVDPSISGDGRFVAYGSYATNLVGGDSNGRTDVFVHDRLTGGARRASLTSTGGQIGPASCGACDAGSDPAISSNGRFVAFVSQIAEVMSGGSDGRPDVYVFDQDAGRTVDRASLGTPGGGDQPTITGDGRYVVFASDNALSPQDWNGARDVYEYDRATGLGTLMSYDDFLNIQGNGASDSPSVSADGTFAAFSSLASNFTAYNHEIEDVFMHEWVVEADPCESPPCTTSRSAPVGEAQPEPTNESAPCTSQWSAPAAAMSRSTMGPGSGRRCKIRRIPSRRRSEPPEPEPVCDDQPAQSQVEFTTSSSQKHHIATNKNSKQAAVDPETGQRFSPWTPQFRRLFDSAGLSMNNKHNIVEVAGHKGPHPFKYHKAVFDALEAAVEPQATKAAKRGALIIRLEALAVQVSTPGTPLNVLVTQGDCDAAD